MSGEKLTPITRKEMFLAKAAGQNIKTPEPITREEMFLSNVSGGGTSGTTDERFKQLVERKITDISDDTVTSVGQFAFGGCAKLTSVNLPSAKSVGSKAFNDCAQLSCVIFRAETICSLANIGAFNNTPFASGKAGGKLIVPALWSKNTRPPQTGLLFGATAQINSSLWRTTPWAELSRARLIGTN